MMTLLLEVYCVKSLVMTEDEDQHRLCLSLVEISDDKGFQSDTNVACFLLHWKICYCSEDCSINLTVI